MMIVGYEYRSAERDTASAAVTPVPNLARPVMVY
jgi:hypothetical protein